jgi:hypothetical protein
MKLIAHRGNTSGPRPEMENRPEYIMKAIERGYDVEVDVWFIDGKFFLGHDRPEHSADSYLIHHPKLWRHAKNLEALRKMLNMGVHCFWHQDDARTLTSLGYVWTHENDEYDERCVIYLSKPPSEVPKVYGICSDYVDSIQPPRPSGQKV